MAFLVHARRRHLAGDGYQRGSIHVGVRDTRYEVGGARTKRGKTHAGLSGETSVHIRHEGRPLFVTGGNESDLAIEQSIHDINVFLARYSEDRVNPFVLEAANKQLSSVHVVSPCWGLWAPPGPTRDLYRDHAIGTFVRIRRRPYEQIGFSCGLTGISHLAKLKPPSYPGNLQDSTGNDLFRYEPSLSGRSRCRCSSRACLADRTGRPWGRSCP